MCDKFSCLQRDVIATQPKDAQQNTPCSFLFYCLFHPINTANNLICFLSLKSDHSSPSPFSSPLSLLLVITTIKQLILCLYFTSLFLKNSKYYIKISTFQKFNDHEYFSSTTRMTKCLLEDLWATILAFRANYFKLYTCGYLTISVLASSSQQQICHCENKHQLYLHSLHFNCIIKITNQRASY